MRLALCGKGKSGWVQGMGRKDNLLNNLTPNIHLFLNEGHTLVVRCACSLLGELNESSNFSLHVSTLHQLINQVFASIIKIKEYCSDI
jgi:hypothetical protein